MHEPEKGEFCFSDNLDLGEFLNTCAQMGLKVLLRPACYICSEWDFGGLPYWLLKDSKMAIRTSDPAFFEQVKSYYTRLAREFIPYLSTNGGPIIAVAVENEYGSFGDDNQYIKDTGDLLVKLGVDVPLYTANGVEPFKMLSGSRQEYWTSVDCYNISPQAKADYLSYQPDKPIFVSEFWSGRVQQWGGYFKRQSADDVADIYRKLLESNAYVNFYMFCGGSNFGFYNGALVGKYGVDSIQAKNRYIPFTTSYDVDALVSESGQPTKKYDACKKVLKEYLQKQGYTPANTETCQVDEGVVASQAIEAVALNQSADLLDNATALCTCTKQSRYPLTMEDLSQDYGFIVYTTFIKHTDNLKRILKICDLHDRATLYGNGEYLGFMMRDRETPDIVFEVPTDGLRLDILVENMGRVNYGNAMIKEQKGICGFVKIELLNEDGTIYPWDYTLKTGWTCTALPLKNLSGLNHDLPAKPNRPAFFSGEFAAKSGVDTFLNMKGWCKGVVWINGFNLGRYWEIGPQETLYVPRELLKEQNRITVLELHSPKRDKTVIFDSAPSLDSIKPVEDTIVSVVG